MRDIQEFLVNPLGEIFNDPTVSSQRWNYQDKDGISYMQIRQEFGVPDGISPTASLPAKEMYSNIIRYCRGNKEMETRIQQFVTFHVAMVEQCEMLVVYPRFQVADGVIYFQVGYFDKGRGQTIFVEFIYHTDLVESVFAEDPKQEIVTYELNSDCTLGVVSLHQLGQPVPLYRSVFVKGSYRPGYQFTAIPTNDAILDNLGFRCKSIEVNCQDVEGSGFTDHHITRMGFIGEDQYTIHTHNHVPLEEATE